MSSMKRRQPGFFRSIATCGRFVRLAFAAADAPVAAVLEVHDLVSEESAELEMHTRLTELAALYPGQVLAYEHDSHWHFDCIDCPLWQRPVILGLPPRPDWRDFLQAQGVPPPVKKKRSYSRKATATISKDDYAATAGIKDPNSLY